MPGLSVRWQGAVMHPAYGGCAAEQLVEPSPSVGTHSKLKVEMRSAPGMSRFSLTASHAGAELGAAQPLPSRPHLATVLR